jgi:ABC-type glutathione transport system ATPase component
MVASATSIGSGYAPQAIFPGPASGALLRVSNLSVRYLTGSSAAVVALDGVTLEIAAGETVGLLGKSGCGKTTFCRAILALLPVQARVTSGSVFWDGSDLLQLGEQKLQKIRGARISMIFQEPALSLHPVMRVGDQIAAVVRAHSSLRRVAATERVEQLLRDVQLEPAERIARAYPHQLSGGQQQRIAIAQALACRPELVIADEPTASLDLTTQAEIIELLRNLRKRTNTSFLIVSHSPNVLAALADRAIVLEEGRIIEEGTMAAILRSPRHAYTQEMVCPFQRLAKRSAAEHGGAR